MGAAHEVILAYALPLTAIWVAYAWARRRAHVQSSAARAAAKEAGLFEPPSLHPLFDPTLCRGCGACVKACPEGDVIGLISGKAALIEPSQCIGHGACRAACPFGAITLVFGTEERGVDIPHVRPNFETNVPGVFIAGELGGMGLIRNAIEQGRQAVAAISSLDGLGRQDRLDLVIVGAGPAGISASSCGSRAQTELCDDRAREPWRNSCALPARQGRDDGTCHAAPRRSGQVSRNHERKAGGILAKGSAGALSTDPF